MYDITIVPPEIWQNIFTLACTDGGRTGYSIALSCRFFHAQSSPARFHSVKLSSIASVERFLAFMHQCPEGQKPVVRHLSLTLLSGLKSRQSRTNSSHTDSRLTDEQQRQAEGRWKDLQNRFINAANELFVLVSPTLRTLCLTTGYLLPLAPFPCDMPVLEELTIMGSTSTIKSANKKSRLPALKRFHLMPRSATADMDVRTTALTMSALCAAPLTHLRLSNISAYERPEISSLLTRTLGLPGDHISFPHGTQVPRDKTHAKLPCVREVVLHTVIPDLGWCGNAHSVGYMQETAAFEGFVRACNHVEGLHMVAFSRRQQDFRWKERLYNDWVSRIEGGNGCWARDAAGEEALEMRVEREGEDTNRSWYEDDFNGADGGYHVKDALVSLLNEGSCGDKAHDGRADDSDVDAPRAVDPQKVDMSRTDVGGLVEPSSSASAVVGRGNGGGRQGKCTIM